MLLPLLLDRQLLEARHRICVITATSPAPGTRQMLDKYLLKAMNTPSSQQPYSMLPFSD